MVLANIIMPETADTRYNVTATRAEIITVFRVIFLLKMEIKIMRNAMGSKRKEKQLI